MKRRKTYRKIRDKTTGKVRSLHQVLAEQLLARPLAPGEIVHHWDGDSTNNEPGNLLVLPSQRYHAHTEYHLRCAAPGGSAQPVPQVIPSRHGGSSRHAIRGGDSPGRSGPLFAANRPGPRRKLCSSQECPDRAIHTHTSFSLPPLRRNDDPHCTDNPCAGRADRAQPGRNPPPRGGAHQPCARPGPLEHQRENSERVDVQNALPQH